LECNCGAANFFLYRHCLFGLGERIV